MPSLFYPLNRGRGGEHQPDEAAGGNGRMNDDRKDSPRSSGQVSEAASPSTASTINLSQEYTLAIQTNSYKEIWRMIHQSQGQGHHGREQLEEQEWGAGEAPGEEESHLWWSSPIFVARVLQPDRGSVQEALRGVPPTRLTRLVSDYLDSSEQTSHFCFSLLRAVERARSIYAPITQLLHLLNLPATPTPRATAGEGLEEDQQRHLTQAQCDWAYDIFLHFDRLDNPFPAPLAVEDRGGGSSSIFQGMRGCFPELKQQLEILLREARRRHQALRRATRGAAACLVASATGVALTGLALATHALVTIMAVGPALLVGGCLPTRDLLAGSRKHLLSRMAQLDAAARGVYVLNNDLDTIERLVASLHAMVESDRVRVRLGLDRGRGQRHPIEEVVRQLRKNHDSFLHQLEDLDEHIVLYFTAVNRARTLLLGQILVHRPQ